MPFKSLFVAFWCEFCPLIFFLVFAVVLSVLLHLGTLGREEGLREVVLNTKIQNCLTNADLVTLLPWHMHSASLFSSFYHLVWYCAIYFYTEQCCLRSSKIAKTGVISLISILFLSELEQMHFGFVRRSTLGAGLASLCHGFCAKL